MSYYTATDSIIPGLRFIGMVTNENVNDGTLVPCYEPAAPEGNNSINTLEGWNAAAERANRRAFSQAFGREPMCHEELEAWGNSGFPSSFKWSRQTQQ